MRILHYIDGELAFTWLGALILGAVAWHEQPVWAPGMLVSLVGGHFTASFVLWWFWGRDDKQIEKTRFKSD